MDPFVQKHINEAFEIATELERKNFMFEHGLEDAPALEDIDAHNNRLLLRQKHARREDFDASFRLNVYACYLGLDIAHNFYKNIHNYKKLPYKIRKGENLVAKLKNVKTGADFQ